MAPIVAILPLVVLAMVLGIVAMGVGVYIALRTRDEMSQRIDHFVEPTRSDLALQQAETEPLLSRLRRRFNTLFAGLDSEDMQHKLVAANWPITGGEYWFIRVGGALLAFIVGLGIFRNILPAAGLAVLAYIVPGFMLFRGIQGRQKRFQSQLIDSLTMIRGAVASGYSFQQALNVVIDEMDSPSSEEFRQVRREVELGLPLGRALFNMASRMESDDFNLVATVIIINIQVGGNLTTILNVVVETIRQRVYLFSEMRALTGYANFAGYLLTLMPVFTLIALSLLSPTYWQQLFQPGVTRYILIYAACSLVVGNIVLRRIAKVNV